MTEKVCGICQGSGYLRNDKEWHEEGFGWDTNPWVWVVEFQLLEVKK